MFNYIVQKYEIELLLSLNSKTLFWRIVIFRFEAILATNLEGSIPKQFQSSFSKSSKNLPSPQPISNTFLLSSS